MQLELHLLNDFKYKNIYLSIQRCVSVHVAFIKLSAMARECGTEIMF